MPDETATISRTKAWLVYRSGALAGTRYLLPDGCTRVGRSPENDIVIQGPNAATVSAHHLEIYRESERWRIRDTGSTNGSYLNGERIVDAELCPQAIVQLGNDGPQFSFLTEESARSELDQTLVIPQGILFTQMRRPSSPQPDGHDVSLSEAVTRARQARIEGIGGQTFTLMRDVVDRALRRSGRRLRIAIYALAMALIFISLYGYWKIRLLKDEKVSIDQRIEEIETRLENAQGTPEQTDRLISELDAYQDQAETLQHSLLYRVGGRYKEDFVTQEIRNLMNEFGAEVYSIPREFVERVNAHIQQYQGPDRSQMERALGEAAPKIAVMRRILEQEKLPPDFAYVPLVESALGPGQTSSAGAAGPWQFTPATARAYGLRVDSGRSE
jgi:pSer/pThr/pTyr-binding forkhead associated (FHA) protein